MSPQRGGFYADNLESLSRRDRIFLNNPVIMQGLGLAPVVVAATNLHNAWILAVAVLLLLTPTRMLATFIGQRIGFKFRAVVYVVVAGLVYVGVAWLVDYWFGTSTSSVGIYLPLLVMEPLIIKRYESPKRERLVTSFKKGMITTAGFCLVMFLMAGLRELLATGMLGGIEIIRAALLPMAQMPAGGFILLGLSFGQASGAIASSFSLKNRYTASALTSDLAWLFGAGFAPLAALALSGKFGLVAGGAYLLSGAICTLLALWLNRELAKGRAGAKA